MASAAPSSSERFHIVLKPDEKRRWAENARAAGLPTAEYVRRAVEAFEGEDRLTATERELVDLFVTELEATAREVHAMVDAICAKVDRPLDEDGMRARAATRLAADPVEFDPDILDFSQEKVDARHEVAA